MVFKAGSVSLLPAMLASAQTTIPKGTHITVRREAVISSGTGAERTEFQCQSGA